MLCVVAQCHSLHRADEAPGRAYKGDPLCEVIPRAHQVRGNPVVSLSSRY